MISFLTSLSASSVLAVLIDAAGKGAIVLLFAAIATFFTRKAPAAARHLIWVAALAVAMILPIASVMLPAYRVPLLPAPRAQTTAVRSAALALLHSAPHRPFTPDAPPMDENWATPAPRAQMLPLVTPGFQKSAPPPAPSALAQPAVRQTQAIEPAAPAITPAAIIIAIWLAGTALLFLWWLVGLLAAWRLTRQTPVVCGGSIFEAAESTRAELGIRTCVCVRAGDAVTMPLASGLVQPCLLLPASAATWPPDQLRSVLLHELAHVKRFDCATQWLAQIACAMYWFNPLAWFTAARLRIERERACDDLVLSHGLSPATYAEHLMFIAQAVRARSILNIGFVAMARPSGLRRRIIDILDGSANRRALSLRPALIAALVAVAILLPLSSVRLAARQTLPPVAASTMANSQPQSAATTQPDQAAPSIAAGMPATMPIAMPAAAPTTQTSRLLELTVLDQSSGQPLAGAKIEFDGEPKNGHATTDASGHATINFKSSRNPWLTVALTHYVEKMIDWSNPNQSANPPTEYTVRLEPGITIGGKVVDDAGQSIAGATVVIQVEADPLPAPHERSWVSYRSTKSAADGSWTFDGIPARSQAINVGVWDFRYVINDGGYGFFEMPAYQPAADLPNHHAVLTLHRGIAVTGVVLGPDGNPVAGARVGFGPDRVASNAIPAFKTTADGRFAFAFKPQTVVIITVTAKGDAPELMQFTLGTEPKDVTIKLQPGRPLEGRVLDPAGDPLPGAYIWLDTWRGYRSLGDKTLRADRNGEFKWTEAPADTVYADVEAPGFMRRTQVPLTAGAPNEVTVQPPLRVTGTVTDATTAKPIPSFRLIHGINWGDGRPTYFEQRDVKTMHDGSFDYTESWPRPAYAVRVEADGYLPAESRVFKADELNVSLQLKLQPAQDWKIAVLRPDGSPAAGAKAVLITSGENNYRFTGEPNDPYDHDHEHFAVSSDGTLDLPPQAGLAKIVVSDDAGYAAADQDALKRNDPIRLQPWAQIHGRLMIGSHPGAGQRLAIFARSTEGFDPKKPSMMLEMYAKSDADGSFKFDRVPPVAIGIGRYVEQGSGGFYTGTYAQTQNIDLQPGQSVNLTIGGTGRAVIGHFTLPPELANQSSQDWNVSGSMRTHFEAPKLPIPDEIKSASADQKQKWYQAFLASDAGKQYTATQQRAFASIRDYPVEISPDGHFRIEDVAAGTYDLSFRLGTASSTGGDTLAMASQSVTMPEMDGGRDEQPLQLPDIAIQMLKTVKVGDVAPNFSAKTLDGHDLKLTDYRGKYVLLDFWATWCGPCVAEIPSIKAVYDSFGQSDRFAMISLSLDEKADDAQQYVKKNNLAWNQVFLPGGWDAATVKDYGVRAIPAIWLIGPDGKVIAKDLRGDAIRSAVEAATGTPEQ